MKGFKLYLIVTGILVLIYVIAQYNKPKPTDWTATYLKEHKIPYGTYILHRQIGSLFPNITVRVSKQRIYNTLKNNAYTGTNLLMVAGSLNLDTLDYAQLVKYLKSGNDVFIAATDLGRTLSLSLKLKTKGNFIRNKNRVTYVNFVNPELKAENSYPFKGDLASQYFSAFDTTQAVVLGRNASGHVNFLKYTFGKGNLYVLPNPRLLTNYNLLNPSGAGYAAKALSYLNTSELLIWDESNTSVNELDSSILRVLLRHPQLKWAYYLALCSLLLFVLFEVKRRQRIIPVLQPLANTSVEFVNVVGRVYYQQRDNRDIAKKKISYFLASIRNDYRLKTTELDAEFLNNLISKSGVQQDVVADLIQVIGKIQNDQKVSDRQLIELNKLIEQFYNQAQH